MKKSAVSVWVSALGSRCRRFEPLCFCDKPTRAHTTQGHGGFHAVRVRHDHTLIARLEKHIKHWPFSLWLPFPL